MTTAPGRHQALVVAGLRRHILVRPEVIVVPLVSTLSDARKTDNHSSGMSNCKHGYTTDDTPLRVSQNQIMVQHWYVPVRLM